VSSARERGAHRPLVTPTMVRYILRRIAWTGILLALVSALTFVIFYVLPAADPAVLRAGRQGSPELVAQIRETLGLNKSIYEQYFLYMKDVILHFDFGYSYQSGQDVRQQIVTRLPATISLSLGAVVVWLAIALPIGMVSAIKRGTALDRITMGGALLAISAPVYWLGLVALYLFARDIGSVPIFAGGGSYVPLTENPLKWLDSLLLPWLVLAAAFAAFYARMLRSNLVEVMGEDYIRTARAKGLSERRVIWRHGVRAAITPVVTVLGLDIGILLGGSILTETVFSIPGVGLYAYQAISSSDLPAIQGTVLFAAFFIIVANLVVDVAYAFLDPRVRYA
jgi:peptide/nickel transport system permease protein